MKKILIYKVPPGEAPLEIRKSWIGVSIPVSDKGFQKKRTAFGVISKPPLSRRQSMFSVFRKDRVRWTSFEVNAVDAVSALEEHNPKAAAWWKEHVGYLLELEGQLIFPSNVCRLIDE